MLHTLNGINTGNTKKGSKDCDQCLCYFYLCSLQMRMHSIRADDLSSCSYSNLFYFINILSIIITYFLCEDRQSNNLIALPYSLSFEAIYNAPIPFCWVIFQPIMVLCFLSLSLKDILKCLAFPSPPLQRFIDVCQTLGCHLQ